MFDVVTDIPAAADIKVITSIPGPHLNPAYLPASGPIRKQFAQPAQMISLGQALAYMDQIATKSDDF